MFNTIFKFLTERKLHVLFNSKQNLAMMRTDFDKTPDGELDLFGLDARVDNERAVHFILNKDDRFTAVLSEDKKTAKVYALVEVGEVTVKTVHV